MNELFETVGKKIAENAGEILKCTGIGAGCFAGGWFGKTMYDKYNLGDKVKGIFKKPTIADEKQQVIEKAEKVEALESK